MNNNIDFLNKIEVGSFTYSTINDDELTCKNAVIDGRNYTKWGKEQTLTFVGLMYSATNKDSGKTVYFVTIGLSKQHPHDIKHDKKIAMETARVAALINPIIVMYDVSPNFNNYTFKQMMETYSLTVDRDFIMTREELKKCELKKCQDQDASFKRDWAFYLNKLN